MHFFLQLPRYQADLVLSHHNVVVLVFNNFIDILEVNVVFVLCVFKMARLILKELLHLMLGVYASNLADFWKTEHNVVGPIYAVNVTRLHHERLLFIQTCVI